MASGEQHAAVLDGMRRLYDGGTVAGLSMSSLLKRFAARRDEAAFAAIVARHGPMVLGVTRRVLRDSHDVEDAFQATFLILVEKAGSIRDGEALGPWLHGVARRVSTRARARASRRRTNERAGLAIEPACLGEDLDRDDLIAAVDQEIDRLPERYRRLVVLCDLEGITQEEAARRLEWTEGTVRGRLAKARRLLRSRLARRGLAPTAGVVVELFATDTASARGLGDAFARATSVLAGVEGVSTTAAALAREVSGIMGRSTLIGTALGAMVVGAALSGGVMIAVLRPRPATESKGERTAPPGLAAKGTDAPPFGLPQQGKNGAPKIDDIPDEGLDSSINLGPIPGLPDVIPPKDFAKPPEPEAADARRIAVGDVLIIEVLESLPGRPVTGERIVRPDGTVSLGFYGDVKLAGLTRREAKVAVIGLMRECLSNSALGLVSFDSTENKYVIVHPARSNTVFVDDSPTFDRSGRIRPITRLESYGPPVLGPASKPSAASDPTKPTTFQPGDRLLIEVLQALPGRPITGERLIRPDGTVSLGFYGDLKLAGLTRAEAKAKIIEHCRQWLSEEVLGLIEKRPDGTTVPVPPERSTSVFVTEVESTTRADDPRIDAMERKLDRVLEAVEAIKR